MPKFVFWNIQRAGGKIFSETTSNLSVDLEAISAQENPDIIILCEGVGDLQKNLVNHNCIPAGYTAMGANKVHGNYKGATTLRYVVMRRNDVQCSCHLIGLNFSRPALLICLGADCYLALHAPSKNSTTTPQSNQMKSVYREVRRLQKQNLLPALNPPRMIFGDLNINVADPLKVGSLITKLQGSRLQPYQINDPGEGTHRNSNTGIYDTTLDWALCRPGFAPTVSVMQETRKVNRQKRKAKHQGLTSQIKRQKMDDFIVVGDDDYDNPDGDFKTEYENLKYPDHKPLVINW